MIKLRRSFKAPERKLPANVLPAKSSLSIEPPKKVIRALYEYTGQSPQELSFKQGDFFHVVAQENDQHWYEACNPATNQRGLVPVSYFQVLARNEKDGSESRKSVLSESGAAPEQRKTLPTAKSQPLYGIVQYDFVAERPDELDAKAGEPIVIVAQSNHEWFVAKPIGRLGGPGLIPASFIEIRNMTTGKAIDNITELVSTAAVPKVEDWKRTAADYKNNSISLGKFDFDQKTTESSSGRSMSHQGTSPTARMSSYSTNSNHYSSSSNNDDARNSGSHLYVLQASVDQYAFDDNRYWFLVHAEMSDGRHRNLCRYYEDFYEFQIALLKEFPNEAGKNGGPRILPYMPGPQQYVDDSVSADRCRSLNTYVTELCELPEHIVHSALFANLFAAKEGDVESTHVTSMMPQPIYRSAAVKPVNVAGVSDGDRRFSQRSSNSSSLPPPPRTGKQLENSTSFSSPALSSKRASNNSDGLQIDTSSQEASALNKANSGKNTGFTKIKIFHREDVIAIRLPSDFTFKQLWEKLRERLSNEISEIRYKDESFGDYAPILDDRDLQLARDRNPKLNLYVC